MMNERILYEACPLCEGRDIPFYRAGDCSNAPNYRSPLDPIIRWHRCASCGHIFTEGYHSEEACEIIFADSVGQEILGADQETARHASALMIERVLPYVAEGQWLDVGFGNGSLLFTAAEYGFTPVGIDLRVENVEILNKLGVEGYAKDIADLRLERKCSVISMADVLEHMPFPKRGLAAARELMEDNGILLISMPNMETMIWNIWDRVRQNPYITEIEHYHNFSRTRLYALLAEFGFAPRRYGISTRYRACMEIVAQKL